jgi:hypothetical protein
MAVGHNIEVGPGSLKPPGALKKVRFAANSLGHSGDINVIQSTAASPNANVTKSDWIACFLWIPPARRKNSRTNAASCGFSIRLNARQITPITEHRPLRKHQAATTQSPMAIPAALPNPTSVSLFANMNPIKAPETTGENSELTFQTRNDAKSMLPKVKVIHNKRAAPKFSHRIGNVKIN